MDENTTKSYTRLLNVTALFSENFSRDGCDYQKFVVTTRLNPLISSQDITMLCLQNPVFHQLWRALSPFLTSCGKQLNLPRHTA